ncbi:hypothetical protein Patl1_00928 [Pistacia atlantica]|uniref:Uncharacterized protein n=1 Tax=Pistacia atlantica TaxID=434234 RepID=A0ACC1C8S1_9ROSI|nr:hypothetical protein Patl1_00928 [Pistacia atlantica]
MDVKTKVSDLLLSTVGSEPEDLNSSPPKCIQREQEKLYRLSHNNNTSMARRSSWPQGKSLCNACGIRYRKTRNAILGLDKRRAEKCKRKNRKECRKLAVSVKMGLMGVGGAMSFKRSLREEEEAAMILMALSCGYMSMQGP